MPRLPLLLALLAACIRPVPLGPDPGECGIVPASGTYSWGEIGIGNCLAGPVDVQFIERDGSTWLAVTNADPYRDFDSGSLLMIDWNTIDLGIGKNLLPAPDGSSTSTVSAHALELDLYAGDVGYLPDRELAIVPTRESEASDTRVHLDRARVVDLADLADPVLWGVDDTIKLRDDPQLVVVDLAAKFAYVGNLTDHSVSVIDWDGDRLAVEADVTAGDAGTVGTPCDGQCALALVDVAPIAALDGGQLLDAGNDSYAEIANLKIEDIDLLVDEVWTLAWVDGQFRIWAEEDVIDDFGSTTGAHGLTRWTSGSVDESFVASALGVELGPFLDVATVEDPYFVLEAGLPILWFADAGRLRRAVNTGTASDWAVVEGEIGLEPVPAAPFLGAPSPVLVDEVLTLFYDQRESAGADATIGSTASEDGLTFQLDDPTPVLDPASVPGFSSFEQPFVLVDVVANQYRMWLSGRETDGSWAILLSESDDGVTWGTPEVVIDRALDFAAPTVQYVNGRYVMWLASGDGAAWSVATAWSYDGRNWTVPTVLFAPPLAYDPLDPPRPAVEGDLTAAWSVEGRDLGVQPVVVYAGAHLGLLGLGLEVVSGHQFSNEILGRDAANGMLPGSLVEGRMYVTGIQVNGRSNVAVLEQTLAGTWLPVAQDVIPAGTGGNATGAGSPAVFRDGATLHMIYAAYDIDGAATMRRATSDDGTTWTPADGALAPSNDDWDSLGQLPHAVELLDDGSYKVWFGGSDGEIWRIGALVADDPTGPWRREEGDFDPWVFGPGTPGSFDDSGVKDPYVFALSGETHMYYAGFDGAVWHLGHAVAEPNGTFVRRTDSDLTSLAAMSGQSTSFSAFGVDSPVVSLEGVEGDALEIWYAGFDGFESRVGLAVSDADRPEVVYPTARFPDPGDTLTFESTRGDKVVSAILLDQVTSEFTTDGIGMSGMMPDYERGFLYVTSKLASFVYVIDIRDDSTLGWEDSNYLDLEGVIRFPSETGTLGFRGGVVSVTGERAYWNARSPDQIFVVDLDVIVDDEIKQVVEAAPLGTLPVRTLAVNEGPPTLSLIGANNGALSLDERYLFVPEYRSNLIDVYDLTIGPLGTLIAEIPYIGEHPHVIRVSPDGRHAVIANYTGEKIEGASFSTLAILDIDPESPTWLEVVTWIGNR